MKHFGDFLSNLRNSKGLSLEELATLVGSSKSTLSRLENNDIPRPFKGAIRKLIINLAKALCISRNETERYLALAGIDSSLLTESEEIQLGLASQTPVYASTVSQKDEILLLNFAHPLTEQQQKQIEGLADTVIGDIINIPIQINEQEPLRPQITRLLDSIGLSADDWYQRYILVNPPGYAPAASLLFAEIHGRIGHFPTLVRLRPKHGSVTVYEVAELLNLQVIRDAARTSSDVVAK